jgi:hypothetical protein
MRLTTHRRHGAFADDQPASSIGDRDDRNRATGGGPGSFARASRTARRLGSLLTALAGTVVVAVLLAPPPAFADPAHTLALAGSVGTVLDNIRNWIMGILAGLATVFLTIGGVRYVMAGGDPGEVQKAKIAFRSAGIGYGLAALAPLAVTVLKGIVGA